MKPHFENQLDGLALIDVWTKSEFSWNDLQLKKISNLWGSFVGKLLFLLHRQYMILKIIAPVMELFQVKPMRKECWKPLLRRNFQEEVTKLRGGTRKHHFNLPMMFNIDETLNSVMRLYAPKQLRP